MTNTYALGICQLCELPMTLAEIAEGVTWEERNQGLLYSFGWWMDDEEECRVAHRRCWKELSERERVFIRSEASKGAKPKSLGQLA